MLGGGARTAGSSAETVGILIAIAAAVLNLGVLAGLTGRTLGKWATGLRVAANKWRGSRGWAALSFVTLLVTRCLS